MSFACMPGTIALLPLDLGCTALQEFQAPDTVSYRLLPFLKSFTASPPQYVESV
jgi:hypothetical protein